MGRGRQKAKATRQAREIKYYSPQTDYTALERELTQSKSARTADRDPEPAEREDLEDKYSDGYER